MRERTFARGLTVGVVVLLGVAASCGGNGKKPVDIARADGGDAAGMGGDAGGGGSPEAGGTTAPVSEECARQACNAGVSDLCCPSSCSAATDIDCAGCGNGRLEAGELCDPAGSCPQACAQLKCQMQQLKSGGTCAAVCVPGGMQTACVDGDECCPAGCTAVNDRDCTGQCGNGTLEPGELCDPLTTCPQTCPMQGCTLMALVEAGTCLARCMEAGQETQCRANDGCCPSGCNAANDSDCAVVCGNGTLEGRETCDPLASCPSACPAQGCRLRQLANGGTCTAVCIDAGLQTTCQSGDGCCPVSCNNTNDTDCPSLCGNSVVESGETCDPISSCMDRERACVSDAATTRTRMGDPGRCTFTCRETTRTCGPADGACPPGCGPIQDPDCPGCGNGVMEANETCDPVTVCLERQRTCISDQSTIRTPGGDPAACTFTCVETPRPCGPVDSNCPAGCTPTRDADCAGCGNGMLDPGETCDPVSVCEQRAQACVSDASTIRAPMGDPDTCRFTCQETPRTCGPADSFCPPNCGPTRDRDCAGCGNGRVESGETCDPCRAEDVRACVGDVNTIRTPRGSAEACTFACDVMPRPCRNGDSFCPSMCTRATDTDCPPGPGDTCGEGVPTCGAGSCVDGRCCVQTCAVCQSCTGPGGTCVAIPAGQQDNVPARACVTPAMCNGQGSCVTPACEVTVRPPRQDFGSVAVGSASTVFTFMVESTCSTSVTIRSSSPNEFTIQTNGCTDGVAPGNPCAVGVVFRPGAGGAREGRLNVVPAMGQATSSTLTGTGQIAQLVWKPDTVQFGRVPVGDQRVQEGITLTNVGTAPTAPIQFPPQAPFSVYKTSCQTLAPNQSCDVVVQFAPEQVGQVMASLQALGGNGVTAALQVQGTGFERQPLTIEPSSHGFGSVLVGARTNPAPFIVRAAVALTGVVARTTSSEFVIVDNGCTGTLAAGGTCTIMVVFAPTVAGPKEGVFLQVSGRENIIIRQPITYTASSSLTGTGRPRIILEPPPGPGPGPVVQ
jgi:Abnormal spindle-like microcephaly-assoc'd, ASPM-SPD-2-Hydin